MASAWPDEETFTCSVCLETLKDPATLPCGHSYCLDCIKSHWDKAKHGGQYSCPQCRRVFNPRPSLAKSTLLAEAIEKLRSNSLKAGSSNPPTMPIYLEVLPDTKPNRGGIYPPLPSVAPRPCPQHNRPLDLFCHDDKECVCDVCCQHGHREHRVLKSEEARKEGQKELTGMQEEVQRRIREAEKTLNALPRVAQQNKALVQTLLQERDDIFSELLKTVKLTSTQVGELLGGHDTSLSNQAEEQINRLQQEVAQLHWKSEELSRLADMQDDICFLKNFHTVEPLSPADATAESLLTKEAQVVCTIRSAMKELQESVGELCRASLTKITTVVKDDTVASTPNGAAANCSAQASTQYTVHDIRSPPSLPPPRRQGQDVFSGSCHLSAYPSAPPLPPPRRQATAPPLTAAPVNLDPKTRDEFLKFFFQPTMDPNTAYRHVQLSEGDHKATMRTENLNLQDHPERFQYWRQVLCREPLAGSPYYWEVKWTGQKVTIGVAYKEIERKGSDDKSRLGHNPMSWTLYWSGTGFSFWHNGQEILLGSPKAQRIGVYLDQHTGTLAFYRITNNQAGLIHRHQTQFSGPLYPGFRFWAGAGATVTICSL